MFRAWSDQLVNWGRRVVKQKYTDLGEHDAVAWFWKWHVEKCGQWYYGATPVGVTTSISGQEGFNPYIRQIVTKGQPTSNFLSKFVEQVLPFYNRRNLFGSHRADPRVSKKMKEDAAHIKEQRDKKLSWISTDGATEMWWRYGEGHGKGTPITSGQAERWETIAAILRYCI